MSAAHSSSEDEPVAGPSCPAGGVPELEPSFPGQAIDAYLATRRRRLRDFGRRRKQAKVEIVGKGDVDEKLARERSRANDEEVGDDWFREGEEELRRGAAGRVAVRLGDGLWRTGRGTANRFTGAWGSHRATRSDGMRTPVVGGAAIPELNVESPSQPGSSAAKSPVSGNRIYAQSLVESPTGSLETIDTLPTEDGGELSRSTSRAGSALPTPSLQQGEQAGSTLGLPSVSEHHAMHSTSTFSTPRSRSPDPSELGGGGGGGAPLRRTNTGSTILTIESGETGKKKAKGKGSRKRDKVSGTLHRHKKKLTKKLKPADVQALLARRAQDVEQLLRGRAGSEGVDDFELERALFAATGILAPEEARIELVYLVQHQRGGVVFGVPLFSSAALFQADPAEWCTFRPRSANSDQAGPDKGKRKKKEPRQLEETVFTPASYSLPAPTWEWLDPEWMVLMAGDCDEQGWSYATRFRSRHWIGKAATFSFVRRRQYIRAMVYVPTRVNFDDKKDDDGDE